MQNRNSYQKLQSLLQKQGWYVAWGQDSSDAPGVFPSGPNKGQAIDPDKVLINCLAEQGLRVTCQSCQGEGHHSGGVCETCQGSGEVIDHDYEYEGGYFHFGSSDKAIEYLIDNLPIIERSECNYDWDILGGNSIFISWSKKDPTLWRLAIVAMFYVFVWVSADSMFTNCVDQASCYVEGLTGMALDQYFALLK